MTSNLRKAAILLMSLPEAEAALMLAKLNTSKVELVSRQIAQLGRISQNEQEEAILDFSTDNASAISSTFGSLDAAKSLLTRALGPDATETINSILKSIQLALDAIPFGFLQNVEPHNLLTFISDEHPQTISLILSHVPPAYGAEVISGLPTETQMDVVSRIAGMGETSPKILKEVEQGLEKRMAAVLSQTYEHAGGVPCVAGILNVCDRTTERTLLENLNQEDPDLVEEIRRLMFVFEDITKLSDRDMQSVLKNVETSQWPMALKGCTDEVKMKVLGKMSQRAAQMLEEEMEYLGPVRVSEVESMQQTVVDIVRHLEEAGEITVGRSSDTESEFIT